MRGGIADEILNNPQLLSALAEKIYEKLKDEIVIKKLEENSESIKALQEEIRKHSEVIASLQQTVNRHTEAIVSLQQAVKSLQETVDRHTEAIKSLQEAVKKQGEAIASLQETVNRHTLAIEGLQEAVKKQGEAIASLQQTVKEHGEAIEALQKAVLRLGREVKKLSVEVGSFTNRAGKGMEKVMLKLYKKALELHGVDPRRVVHGFITDDEGVIEKGKVFEVDFYETNDYVYVFEIKNLADKGVYDRIIIRKKLFSTKSGMRK